MRERLFCMESPTHVGNTHGVLRRGSAPAVHPHACGEYITGDGADSAAAGSSPRVWGIRSPASNRASWIAVHPHACGEYSTFFLRPCPLVGSSPRVWGIQALCTPAGCRTRFIPTRVGNTIHGSYRVISPPVHPHACGEYSMRPCGAWVRPGSSPRVWGIPEDATSLARTYRFIPTRVGNTHGRDLMNQIMPVHPHACGEYAYLLEIYSVRVGSSPRVWGILFRKMQEITDCWQSSSVLPSHACCKPAPMTIKRGRSFVKRLLPLVKNCPAGQSRSLDVTCPDRRNARLRS